MKAAPRLCGAAFLCLEQPVVLCYNCRDEVKEMLDIYGTLGPKCADAETLEKMIRNGMTGMRLNLSHGTLWETAPQIKALREAERRSGRTVKLLVDMQGPELRIGKLAEPLTLTAGETVRLKDGPVPFPETVFPFLNGGQEILLDDGKLLLRVTDDNRAAVIRGGTLAGRKSIALPAAGIYPPTMTEDDLANIRDAKAFGVSGVMQPFVRSASDLRAVRNALDEYGCGDVRLFAKIENLDGVRNLDDLIPECDEIVIARGDLGNAVPLWELPALQKQIAAKCREAGKPFMVVTQMLASMERSPVPTRAEVSDIYNAVLDGASSVMVTGETAVGEYPVEVIKYLANTAKEAEKIE